MDPKDQIQLENAARIVLSPPNEVTSERRAEAESVFLQMKKLSRPYALCKAILESDCSDYVRFQAVATMKEGLLREWSVLPLEEKVTLRQYLMTYVIRNTSLPQYVRQHLMLVVAVIIKRGLLEEDGQSLLDSFICDISQLLSNSTHIELGCSLLSNLLSEVSSSSGSSALGMPLEFHVKCKNTIEQNGGLLKIFTLAVQVLGNYASLETKQISCLLSLNLNILSWNFRSSYLHRSHHLDSSTNLFIPLKPPQEFRAIFFNPVLLDLFVKVFKFSFSHPDLTHTSSQCLSQLASLSGPIFSSTDDSQMYLEMFLQIFLPSLIDFAAVTDDIIYGVACTFRQLVTTFSRIFFSSLNMDLLQSLTQSLTDYVGLCCQRITKLENDQEDSSLLEESLCYVLEVFVRLLDGPCDDFKTFLSVPVSKIVSLYLQSKLNEPQGLKHYQTGTKLDLDLDSDDRDSYADELSYIGTLCRHVAATSLPTLLRLFFNCFSQCIKMCQSLLVKPTSVDIGKLEALYDDIHWLLLIATYTLTDVVESEESTIPTELVELSLGYQNTVTTNLEQLITTADYNDAGCLLSIDPVVSLIVCLCHWSVIERQLLEQGLKDVVSPQVCESAIWGLSTVLSTYLMTTTKYDKIGPILYDMVVGDSENSRWLLSFILDKIAFNISVWHNEEKLTHCTVKTLYKLTRRNKTRAVYLCGHDTLWLLMRTFANGNHPFTIMSPAVQRDMIAGLLSCANGSRRDQYLNELLQPLSIQFNTVMEHLNNGSLTSDDTLQKKLLFLLESLCGVASATSSILILIVFPFLLPLLYSCVQLLQVFSDSPNISLIIFKLFESVTENFTIFLSDTDALRLYDVCLGLITTYANFFQSKYVDGKLSDDDSCEDLLLFIQTLSHLTTKDYFDFSSSDSTQTVAPIDVVLKGLSVVLPTINEEILKYPELCRMFYELLHYICDIFPESFAALPEHLLSFSLNLIDIGCTRFSSDISLLCIECVETMADCSSTKNTDMLTSYNHYFLKVILSRLLNEDVESDLVFAYSGAVYQLMCFSKGDIDYLVTLLLPDCTDEMKLHTLHITLESLVPSSLLTGSRVHKRDFKKKFTEQLPTLRGNICIN